MTGGEMHNERDLFMDKRGDMGSNRTLNHFFKGINFQSTDWKAILESVFADVTQAFMLCL